MISESENVQNPPNVNEFSVVVTVVKIVIFAIFLLPLAQYSIDLKANGIDPNATEVYNNTISTDSIENVEPAANVNVQPVQPFCPPSDKMNILNEICEELREKHDLCSPEDEFNQDQHKIPKRTSVKNQLRKETELPTIVNYALGIILIASLGAALLELYKAKMQPTKKNGKSPLSRKCSLAELTVLKHQRKEMLRRDSLMELPEENLYALGSRPPPLQRRCSFPVGTTTSPFDSYGIMNDSRRPSMIRQTSVGDTRRQYIVYDSRRQSIIINSRKTSIDYGSLSVESSPERRHRSRLVNRH